MGLTDFVFHHNMLGPQFIVKLGHALRNDRYCRSIDLRNNMIADASIDAEFFANLMANETVVNLDLRDNRNIDKESLRKVALNLIRNVSVLKG